MVNQLEMGEETSIRQLRPRVGRHSCLLPISTKAHALRADFVRRETAWWGEKLDHQHMVKG